MLFYSKEVFNKLVYKHLFSIMGLEVLCKMKAKSNSFMGAIFSKKINWDWDGFFSILNDKLLEPRVKI